MSTRPIIYSTKRIETFYVDFTTGRGISDAGHTFTCQASRGRKNPTLRDKLETVAHLANQTAEKATIVFTGKVPKAEPGDDGQSRHWLLVDTGQWEPEGHWLGTPPTGRFRHATTRKYIEVRTAAEWFGSTRLSPPQAREAFQVLDAVLGDLFAKHLPAGTQTALMKTPGATGMNLWAASLPKSITLEPVSDDIAEELHATSGQHHLEHTVAGPSADEHPDVVPMIDPNVITHLDRFAYVDGRFMYASLCNRLGLGPGVRLNQSKATELLEADPYCRARFRVKFTVPNTWHHIGIFGCQHRDTASGWYYPNRPGATGESWADAAEVFVARKFGWAVEPLEAVVFSKQMPSQRKRFHGDDHVARRSMTEAKPLDAWAKKLTDARAMLATDPGLPPLMKTALGAALRAILIQTIGKFASRGRGMTQYTKDPKTIPPEAVASLKRLGEAYVYLIPQSMSRQQQMYYRPEFSVQVWGRGRAKVLHNTTNGVECGALTMPGSSIVGINGDAIYSSYLPQWALPQEQGGVDDGKAGRLRLQGYLDAPVPTPTTRAARDTLRDKALKAGAQLNADAVMDQAAFDFEFTYQDDQPTSYTETTAEEA
ncbi:hypothetical protein [Kocuria salsicia]|uniref:hypothetical protein n=1 Tax=Kocuria salsicia TaxID=664639 RepID=UPI0011A8E345|nr:hypothetical protein [Kocuria salsicia]